MKVLNGAARDLLIELVENKDADIANILAKKFDGLSINQDSRLRGIIDYLIRQGYLEIPDNGWADNVPYIASLTYEGENYLDFEEDERKKEMKKYEAYREEKQEMTKPYKLKKIIDDIDEVKKCFHLEGGNGIPRVNVISGDLFETWRSSIQFEINQLEKDEFITSILKLTNNFSGWRDEKNFTELCSKLKVLYDNTEKYFPNIGKEDAKLDKKKVFVVHGRNEKIRDYMFAFLRAIGLEPIEWDEAKRMTGKENNTPKFAFSNFGKYLSAYPLPLKNILTTRGVFYEAFFINPFNGLFGAVPHIRPLFFYARTGKEHLFRPGRAKRKQL